MEMIGKHVLDCILRVLLLARFHSRTSVKALQESEQEVIYVEFSGWWPLFSARFGMPTVWLLWVEQPCLPSSSSFFFFLVVIVFLPVSILRKVGLGFDRRSMVGVGSKFFGRFVVRGL